MAALSTSTWGEPSATKRVLLIHGIISILASHCERICVPRQGYLVVAPDLLGHGNARRGSDYTIAALAEELQPLFTTPRGNDHPWDIVVGQSLGGVVASVLLPLLRATRTVRVVLSDPPLEVTPESIAHRKRIQDSIGSPERDAVFKSLSLHLCDAAAVDAILGQNVPWSFSHHLLSVPDNVKVTVLAADPSKEPCVREDDLKLYPHVAVKTVWGASHSIPLEFPLVITGTALEDAEVRELIIRSCRP